MRQIKRKSKYKVYFILNWISQRICKLCSNKLMINCNCNITNTPGWLEPQSSAHYKPFLTAIIENENKARKQNYNIIVCCNNKIGNNQLCSSEADIILPNTSSKTAHKRASVSASSLHAWIFLQFVIPPRSFPSRWSEAFRAFILQHFLFRPVLWVAST